MSFDTLRNWRGETGGANLDMKNLGERAGCRLEPPAAIRSVEVLPSSRSIFGQGGSPRDVMKYIKNALAVTVATKGMPA